MSGRRIIEGLEQALAHARGDRSMTDDLADHSLENAVFAYNGGKRSAQIERRAWRAKQRAANRPPLSDKVVHPRVLVALPPRVKKGKVTSR